MSVTGSKAAPEKFAPPCTPGVISVPRSVRSFRALWITKEADWIGSEAFQQLMDRELDPEVQQEILATASAHPDVVGVHDLRTRRSGRLRFVQLHLELDHGLPLTRAHAVADEVEERILAVLPHAEVLIHQDPVSTSDEA